LERRKRADLVLLLNDKASVPSGNKGGKDDFHVVKLFLHLGRKENERKGRRFRGLGGRNRKDRISRWESVERGNDVGKAEGTGNWVRSEEK